MSHAGKDFQRRSTIACLSIVMAIFTSAPILAQQKALVISPDAAAVRALSVINRSGSYVLNRNIVNNSRTGADSVQITVPNVVLDLSGFSIICTGTSTGAGINATAQTNVVIRDGIITGCGGPAIIGGTNANISGITATGNATATSGLGAAIQAGTGSQISSNIVNGSGAGGISCGSGTGCLIRDNVIQANTGFGITLSDATGGYRSNVMQGNDGNTVGTSGQVSGGTSLGQNLCNGTTC
jgi:hypothetical protein